MYGNNVFELRTDHQHPYFAAVSEYMLILMAFVYED